MRWFRFYGDAINDPKVLKLSDRLHRVWVGLLCIASQNDDGKLPSMEDCALMLRLQTERMAEALVSLVGAGLLDRDETGLSPHNWASRQYKSDGSAERMARLGRLTLQSSLKRLSEGGGRLVPATARATSLRGHAAPP